jgi:predicted nucleotidyltransferase
LPKGLDTEKSDVDFLIDTEPQVPLLTIGGRYYELEQFLDSKIDLVTTGSIPESVKSQILEETRPIRADKIFVIFLN